jgi:DNA polymerase III delta prime subunit
VIWNENNLKDKEMPTIGETLDRFLTAENLLHSFLFIGGSEEHSQARKTAESFAGKITYSAFPNVDTLSFDANDGSGIAGIRETLELAALMPLSSKHKAVLLINMDQASASMQNALLKNLEEPPEHTIFLLVSTTPLLPTIMSRCQVFSVPESNSDPLLSENITELLELLKTNRRSGQVERMVLVNKLADVDEEILPKVLEAWLSLQVAELGDAPQKFPSVRVTMETIESLKRNFNKKIVLQQFTLNGL